jgi:hypothetical protein
MKVQLSQRGNIAWLVGLQSRLRFCSILFSLISKCRNSGKSWFGIGISSGSQLLQSDIGIPASGFSPVPLVTDKSGIAQLWDLRYQNEFKNVRICD